MIPCDLESSGFIVSLGSQESQESTVRLQPIRPGSQGSPPAAFGAPVVMGDPTTVPEQEITPEPDTELDTLWLKLPAEIADFFDLGFRHGEDDCPEVVLKPLAGEVIGPAYAFASLAQVILTLCQNVPCIAGADREDTVQRQAG